MPNMQTSKEPIQVTTRNNVTYCSGPIGCGKTTYARTAISEALDANKRVCVLSRHSEYNDLLCKQLTLLDELIWQEFLSIEADLFVIDSADWFFGDARLSELVSEFQKRSSSLLLISFMFKL